MKVIAILHGPKQEGLQTRVPEIGFNPPMTVDGMEKILALVPAVREHGPFDGIWASRISRALDAASVLATAFDMEIATLKGLGQNANLDNGKVIFAPGSEGETYSLWQRNGLDAMRWLLHNGGGGPRATYIVVSHRPVIGGIVAHTLGLTGDEELTSFIREFKGGPNGFVVLDVDVESIKVVG